MPRLSKLLVSNTAKVCAVLATIEAGAHGIALIVDEEKRLLGTITDGDIRRATLAGVGLGDPAINLLNGRERLAHKSPMTAPPNTTPAELLRLMNQYSLQHIPIVDDRGVVIDIAVLSELTKEFELPLTAVIMAGGYGKRLRPLTDNVPKPMLEVGDRPLLEVTVSQLRESGIRRINLISHYRSDVIMEHFGNGDDFGVTIEHVLEDQPMGTAGGLGLLERPDQPLLVMNGDILTHMDFKALYRFHCDRKSHLTVGVRAYEVQIPFGVVETDGEYITEIREKPVVKQLVNAGIYLLDPEICRDLPKKRQFDMTDVISLAIANEMRVVPFVINDYWLDIGSLKDYEQAQRDITIR